MLSSINFLSLLSLGFLSWTILCYIQQIEQFVHLNTNIPQQIAKQENPVACDSMSSQEQTLPTPSVNNYDLFLYLICAFICIYVLVKITHLAEMYLAKSIRHSIYIPITPNEKNQNFSAIKSFDTQETLKLEDQNSAVKFKLGLFEYRKMTPVDPENKMNVCIFNKYIQLNHDVYVDNRTILDTIDGQESDYQRNIWEKYMKLKIESLLSKEQSAIPIPVVMSKEEFENIKGIF